MPSHVLKVSSKKNTQNVSRSSISNDKIEIKSADGLIKHQSDSSSKNIISLLVKKTELNCKYPEPIPSEIEEFIEKCSELYLENKFIECATAYSHLIAVYPDYCVGYYNRGLAKYYSGDKDGAKMDFEKALTLGFSEAKLILIKYYEQ